MTIHHEHPFAEADDDPVRRFRGRVGGTVSLWTAGAAPDRAGLTLTSFMVVHGEPARVVGALDPESALAEVLDDSSPLVVQLLEWRHRSLAEAFAGLLPAPGGAFRMGQWRETEWGPVLTDASAWLGARLVGEPRPSGWSQLVEAAVEHVEVGTSEQPLLHRRGRYLSVGQAGVDSA